MRPILHCGRHCRSYTSPLLSALTRPGARRAAPTATPAFSSTAGTTFRFRIWNFRRPPRPGGGIRILIAGSTGAALSSAAFVRISEESNGDGKTAEEHMLEVSREELANQVPKPLQNSKKVRRNLFFFVEAYIVEPVLTAVRFLHLLVIFVPVIITVPAIWIGSRVKSRDGERTGTLWWYGFLVRSMERAGAAYIKVGAR